MKLKSRLFAPLAAALALAFTAPALARQAQEVAAAPAPQLATPALWKVADEDTTIYLFGTIHLLPRGIDWFRGPIANAFASAGELVTEIPEGSENEAPALIVQHGTLPKGQSLRALLTEGERTRYEAALAGLGLPAAALDGYKPWYAAVVMATLPLVQQGYDPSHGVESELTARNTAPVRPRTGLETLAFQLSLFDRFSPEVQKRYLFEVIDALPTLDKDIGAMIDAWAKGDAAHLAELMNAEEDDPAMVDALITQRNKTWAGWIRQRLGQPGTVFVAVGAGHLGGAGSVQDQLASGGIKAQRVQ